MFTENTYSAEIAYRSDRIRHGIARKRRTRAPFVRRPAETTAAH